MLIKTRQTTLLPLHDRVVCTRDTSIEDTTDAYVIKPESTREKPQEGTVVWVGTGKVLEDGRTLPVRVKPGDTILFGKFSGQDVTLGNVDYLILREDEILGIISVIEIEEEIDLEQKEDGTGDNVVGTTDAMPPQSEQ